jgi:hypothetical protein
VSAAFKPYAHALHFALRAPGKRRTHNDPFQSDYEPPLEGHVWDALRTLHDIGDEVDWMASAAAADRALADIHAATESDWDLAEPWRARQTVEGFRSWLFAQITEHGLPDLSTDSPGTIRLVEAWVASDGIPALPAEDEENDPQSEHRVGVV